MSYVHEVKQRPDELLTTLDCQYTPYDPSSKEHKTTVTMAFIDQASKDIRKRCQRLERQDKSLRDLVQVAEKVYHTGRQRKRRTRERERKKSYREGIYRESWLQ